MSTQNDMWMDLCAVEDIPLRGARVVKSEHGCVAVFRTGENEVFALDDSCPHKQGPLSEGIVHGKSVTCPLHNWVISLETGMAEGADEGQVPTREVRIQDGRVRVALPYQTIAAE